MLGATFWDRIRGAVLRLPRRGACAGCAEGVDFRKLEDGDRPCDHLFDGSEKPGGRVAYHVRVKLRELVDKGHSAS